MAKGNNIIITVEPRGRFLEGIVTGAIKPGTFMQVDTSEGINASGRLTWEPYNNSVTQQGAQRLPAILLPDSLQGKLATAAYVTGDQCFIYVPIAGEELNMLVLNLSGTADDHAFGDTLIVNDGDGKLVANAGSPESEPFILMEAIVDPTADTLAHVMFTGY